MPLEKILFSCAIIAEKTKHKNNIDFRYVTNMDRDVFHHDEFSLTFSMNHVKDYFLACLDSFDLMFH